MNKKTLFTEFDSVPTKAWKQKIQVDLKGADYNETLVWDSPEGLKIKPFYNRDDLTAISKVPFPPNQWFIGQRILVTEASQANQKALFLLTKGVESLIFENRSIPRSRIRPE